MTQAGILLIASIAGIPVVARRLCVAVLLLSPLAWCSSHATAQVTKVHYRIESLRSDRLYEYYLELLTLALDSTKRKYGDYELVPLYNMNFSRALITARKNTVANFIFGTSYSREMAAEFALIDKPIDMGLLSYRVCFTSTDLLENFKHVHTLDDLIGYTIGQGSDWLDVPLLRANGLTVVEYPIYNTLFSAVARGRFDLFCRGISELKIEWDAHKSLDGLAIEKYFALYYPFPRFLWTNTRNTQLVDRLTEGLNKVLESGQAKALTEKHHRASIDFSNLRQRTLIRLKNPNLVGLKSDFEKYFFNPLE
ncbi:hypothetical protein P886_3610 [Alteromonadaceae bacterium 2753L.S.0a.02]|nr:hypothetical protein P886_3610 [Alteromonadaceae bacterium 2753L.S.0a.02]